MKTDDFRLACDSAIQFSEWAFTDREKDLGGSSDQGVAGNTPDKWRFFNTRINYTGEGEFI